MLSIRSSADVARALDGPMDPELRRLLMLRQDQLLAGTDVDVGELVHIIVVCRSDTLVAVEAEAGMPLVTDPPFEWVQRHDRWLEAAVILNDDGFALVLFVPNCVTTDPALLLPLLAHA